MKRSFADRLKRRCPPAYVCYVIGGAALTAALVGTSLVLRPLSKRASDAVENAANAVNTAGLWPRK